jgi:hypothetical protein
VKYPTRDFDAIVLSGDGWYAHRSKHYPHCGELAAIRARSQSEETIIAT